jgi:glycosyltransferase involved in cell wall biosynthesis
VRVLIDYRPALRQPSGAGEYTHQLVRALSALSAEGDKARLELTLFSSSWKDRLVDPGLPGVQTVDRRIPVRLLNLFWHRVEWPAAEMITGCRYDVTHSSHPLLLPARRAAKVVTIHDLHFLTHPGRTRAEIRRDYPALARRHARRADRILVPSRFTAAQVAERFEIASDRIVVCPPGAPEWPARTVQPADGYLLFFGTLEPRKNVGGLLDAYERLIGLMNGRAPELVLAGKATAESRAWLERLARPPLRGRARHIGYVDPTDRQALFARARLLVQPSFEEGFGLPVLEAMTVGLPVVASNRGSLPEVLGDAGALVNPESPEDLAGAIAALLEDRTRAQACADKGIRRAEAFRWDRTAARVLDAYRQAVERHQCESG